MASTDTTTDQYIVVPTGTPDATTWRVHKHTCKRAQGKGKVVGLAFVADAADWVAASCCKPKLAVALELLAARRRGVEAAAADLQASAPAIAEVLAEADRAGRLEAAKREAAAVKAWREAGAEDTPPPTPNLDAINAEAEASGRTTTGAKQAKGTTRTTNGTGRGDISERAQQARARKAQGKRGPGRRLDAEAFAQYVAKVRADHPGEARYTAMEYAYWVDGLAFSRKTWEAAWAAAEQA